MADGPEEEEGHGDFGADHHDDPVEVAVDETLHAFAPKGHGGSDKGEAEEAGEGHVGDEGEDPEMENAGGEAEGLEGKGEEGAEEDGPNFVVLKMDGELIEVREGNEVGYDIGADEIPEEMADEVAGKPAQGRCDRPDADVKEDVFSVLEAEEHEDGVKGDEKEEFEAEEERDPQGGFIGIGLLDGPIVQLCGALSHRDLKTLLSFCPFILILSIIKRNHLQATENESLKLNLRLVWLTKGEISYRVPLKRHFI